MNENNENLTPEVEVAEEPKMQATAKSESKRKSFWSNKRNKLIVFIAAAVLLVAIVTVALIAVLSGSDTISSYYDLFDEDVPFTRVTYNTQYVAIPELDGYAIDSYTDDSGETVELVNEEFAVFVKLTDTGILSHKVLSLRSGKVVATLAEKNAIHSIRLDGYAPVFVAKKTVIDPDIDITLGLDNVISVDYMLYDAAGNCVVTTDFEEMPYELADLLIYDHAAYSYDKAGVVSKVTDIPEYLLLEECFDWNDKYIYVKDSNDGYTVYDREFNSVSYWSAPGYNMDGCDMYVMNSLNVLVQYKVIMDNDAEDFDYVINNDDYKNLKIDLETFIVDVETGEARELEDFNYVIGALVTRESMVRGSEEENAEDYFKFENLIILIPIAQNRLDDSERAIDMRVMTDKGDLKKSVKLVDFQTADIPSQISEELFTVRLLSGQVAIIKEDGTVLHKLDKSYRIVDQYIVGTQAIYDFDLNKVYDLRANKATVMGIIENTIYVNAETDNGYNVIAFRGGETKTLYTFNAESPSGNVFELIEDAHCYMIFNAGSGEFSYYNSEDERITNIDEILTVRYASERHSTYLMWTESALEPSYCLFVGAAE